jgi:hypothetical protein
VGGVRDFFTTILPGRGAGGAPPPPAPTLLDEDAPPPARGAEWGLSPEHLSGAYDANEIHFGERARELDYRSGFYFAKLHDWKPFDMNGVPISGGQPRAFPGSQGFMAAAGEPRFVPISQRRPNAPYRLPRTIVKAFTGMLFGLNRWPQIRSDDPDTQAFCEAVVKAADVRNRFQRGRNLGGAAGVCGFSWHFREGRPVVRVHHGRYVQALEWSDPDELEPAHVTELYISTAVRVTDEGRPERYQVWVRRDWTEVADVVFKPQEVTGQNPGEWVVDEDRSYAHGDGFCHFVWATNFPNDEDPSAVDGQPDYAELYEQMDTLDGTNSILVRGVTKNLDPTLVIKRESPEQVQAVRKGSENAIVTDLQGDAKYLTLESGVVDVGERLVELQRRQVLEVAQCIVADPDKVAAAGTSSLTMKLVYAPMISATDLLRESYGKALVRLLEQILRSARRLLAQGGKQEDGGHAEDAAGNDQTFDQQDLPPEEQEPEVVEYYVDLPKRTVTEEVLGPDGLPTGETRSNQVDQSPGNGKVELEWGEYFPPTSDDKQKTLVTYSTASGAKPVISQRTAVEATAALMNKDATEEWQRVTDEAKREHLELPDAGGGDIDEEPDPSDPKRTTPAPPPDDEPEEEPEAAE